MSIIGPIALRQIVYDFDVNPHEFEFCPRSVPRWSQLRTKRSPDYNSQRSRHCKVQKPQRNAFINTSSIIHQIQSGQEFDDEHATERISCVRSYQSLQFVRRICIVFCSGSVLRRASVYQLVGGIWDLMLAAFIQRVYYIWGFFSSLYNFWKTSALLQASWSGLKRVFARGYLLRFPSPCLIAALLAMLNLWDIDYLRIHNFHHDLVLNLMLPLVERFPLSVFQDFFRYAW